MKVRSTTWKASILLLFLAAASQAEQVTTDKLITADPAKPANAPASAPGADRRWTLATDDTVLTLGVTERGEPAVYELKNRQTQANWIDTPSVFPLIERVQVGGKRIAVNWKFQRAETDETNGTRLTLRFACDTPGLEFASEWWSRPGRGPIRHAAFITNRGDGPVVIGYQATVALALTAPRADEPSADPGSLWMWHFSSDGSQPHPQGVFREKVTPKFGRVLRTDPYAAPNAPIPLVILDLDGRHGVYVGIEWSYGDMRVRGLPAEDGPDARLEAGNVFDFSTSLAAGQRFDVPPGFIGAYAGDVDAAGNSLRKYLFRYSMPEIIRADPTYPKVQWNSAFAMMSDPKGPWGRPSHERYNGLLDAIMKYDLGFEEIMIDVGWWPTAWRRAGGRRVYAGGREPDPDKEFWPTGIRAAADHTHQLGMRFGLYWTDTENMATPEGRKIRAERIKRLFAEHGADIWRSDCTVGLAMSSDYWSVKGFYDMVDGLQQTIPGFQWENCHGGGRIKDYGAMKRSVKIFGSDGFSALDVRRTFHDSSFAFHPVQLMGHLGFFSAGPRRSRPERKKDRPRGAAGMRYAFRSMSMGAPEWFIGPPDGGSETGGSWSVEEREAVRAAVATFKNKIRPLVRSADLYHIFPRPDDKVWDGIQYYDPAGGKGVVFIFKPKSTHDTQAIKPRGLDAGRRYRLTFEDGSNPQADMTGAELLTSGIAVTLKGQFVSELMFIEARDEE